MSWLWDHVDNASRRRYGSSNHTTRNRALGPVVPAATKIRHKDLLSGYKIKLRPNPIRRTEV